MATEASSSQPQPIDAPADNVNKDSEPISNPPQQQQQQQQPSSSKETPTNSDVAPQDPPASPPLPTRHIAITPGARAQRLLKLFDSALTHTLSKISLDNFATCYPTIATQAPHVLQSIQRGLIDRMGQLCQDEFGRTLERYEVIAKLNELESLVGEAAQRRKQTTMGGASRKGKGREGDEEKKDSPRPTPPHMLPAEAVLAAHLAPHLASQQSQLNARLQNTQAANVGLWEEIAAQRAEIEGLLSALEGALKDVDGAADLMDGVPAEELAKESRQVEAQMMEI
ncbi:hypothetical protein N0V93_005196 [Gnomoniopsis smithogilvyi]|uniref:Nnf1-domain-containing protein n=1 Tax=Gnomoniopsis smithogilvyi TaxID=1191159 RepID=A0A9W9CWI5_9PEZI|nr:hypothetical protein N0V93_005196 [Gnomoniopsis smithogilvyi]